MDWDIGRPAGMSKSRRAARPLLFTPFIAYRNVIPAASAPQTWEQRFPVFLVGWQDIVYL